MHTLPRKCNKKSWNKETCPCFISKQGKVFRCGKKKESMWWRLRSI